jgi:CIC family chloride channel protein
MNNESKIRQDPDSSTSAEQMRTEIQEYLDVRNQRRRVFPRAALVGLFAGLVSVLFRFSLAGADSIRNDLIAWSQGYPAWGWIFPMLFGATGAFLSVVLVRKYAPETSGSGIPHLEAVLHRFRQLHCRRVLPIKFLGGILAIGSGLAIGREGPSVQMGGAVADAASRWLKVAPLERLTLIAAGAGAGLSAAFNAPLAGLVFVLEEVRRDFRPIVFGAAFIAAASADIVACFASGQTPVFLVPSYPTPPLSALPAFTLLGIIAGIVGVAFNRSLIGTLEIFSKLHGRWNFVATALVGACAGLIGWYSPILVGGGHELSEKVLLGQVAWTSILIWLVIRFLLTITSYGTGAPGGIFAPLLGIGALIGLGIGEAAAKLAPSVIEQPAVFAVVGMAAYFTAIVRAPLTGIVLILEMTGNYQQMLPLLVSCFAAYAVAEFLKELPIYEALLERDLMKGGIQLTIREPTIFEFEIEPQSRFEGQIVRDLGLPAGCLLVKCVEGGREWIPTALTQLEAHMRIMAVIAPDAINSLKFLQDGCKAREHDEYPDE